MAKDTIEINLDLGANLKKRAAQAARASGITLNEFICNALDSRIRYEKDHEHYESFVRHGGKYLHGKTTGYEITTDGKYYPAPCWKDQFEQLFAERQAIHLLINQVYATAQERLVVVEKQIQQVKARLIDDIGLDPQKEWVYYYDHHLEERKPETKENKQ